MSDAEIPEAESDETGATPAPSSDLLGEITGAARIDFRSNVLVPLLAILSALIVGAVIIAFGDLDTLRLFRHPTAWPRCRARPACHRWRQFLVPGPVGPAKASRSRT